MKLDFSKLISDAKKITPERKREIEEKKEKKFLEEKKKEIQIQKLEMLNKKIPKRFLSVADMSKISKSVIEYNEKFLDNIRNGINLGVAGETGTGKTFDIFWILQKNLYTTFQYIQLNILFDTEQVQKDIKVLFIDDIDKVPTTKRHDRLGVNDWYIEQLYYFVDYRYRNMLPIFFTTNLNRKGLLNLFGDALTRRLLENTKISIKIKK